MTVDGLVEAESCLAPLVHLEDIVRNPQLGAQQAPELGWGMWFIDTGRSLYDIYMPLSRSCVVMREIIEEVFELLQAKSRLNLSSSAFWPQILSFQYRYS